MITVKREHVNSLSNEELVLKYQRTFQQATKDRIAEILLMRVQRIIVWVADKYANIPNTDREDRISELYFTFYKALNQYSFNKGMRFTSFCRKMFESDMLNLYQYKKRKKRYTGFREVSLENLLEEGGFKLTITGSLGAGVEVLATVDLQDYSDIEFTSFLRQIGLTEREMAICCYFLAGGTKKSELARSLNVSAPMISKYMKNIGKKLHNYSAMSSHIK